METPPETPMAAETPVVVLTTLPMGSDALAFARTLVSERLAACVSLLSPMQSLYCWQGTIEDTQERQVLIKTVAQRVPALDARVRTLHPYEVPEFLVLRVVDGGERYLAWVRDSTMV
jgi:periplasmic divalent cation tolerance protein